MTEFKLKTYRVNDIAFTNRLVPNTKIEIGNKYSYSVGYAQNNICRGEFTAELFNKNDRDNFYIKVTLVGVFEYDGSVSREKLHVGTFKSLFPIVRAYIVTLTANAGIPPVFMPETDIDNQDIYRLDIKNNNKES